MTPEQQTQFDFEKLLVAAVVGFIFGMAGNVIVYYGLNRDRRLRMLEREGKRHRFWKDFFQTQEALPAAAKFSTEEMAAVALKCKT